MSGKRHPAQKRGDIALVLTIPFGIASRFFGFAGVLVGIAGVVAAIFGITSAIAQGSSLIVQLLARKAAPADSARNTSRAFA